MYLILSNTTVSLHAWTFPVQHLCLSFLSQTVQDINWHLSYQILPTIQTKWAGCVAFAFSKVELVLFNKYFTTVQRRCQTTIYMSKKSCHVHIVSSIHDTEVALIRIFTWKCCHSAGPPLKLSERVVRTVPLQTQAIRDLMTKLNLGLQTGLDADPDNVVAVSTFVYGASHAPMQVWPEAPPHLSFHLPLLPWAV